MTTSIWTSTVEMPEMAELTSNERADVCVVGAGIAGMTAAYMLAREGKSVLVVEQHSIGGGQTGFTTAHLSNAIDDRYQEMEKIHGQEMTRLAAESHSRAIDAIERIVFMEKIDCDFERVSGYLFTPPGESQDILQKELEAAHRAGLIDVSMSPEGLRFPRQAQFHPMKYILGLARAIQRDGGRIYTQTHVNKIETGRTPKIHTSSGHTITAGALIVATNVPINNVVTIHTKQAPYRTYVVGARIPKNSIPHALYWDTLDPYHYVRVQRRDDHDILIVGGEDHKTGQADDGIDRFDNLMTWARERYPQIERFEHRWSGQVIETMDGLAFIGRNPADGENVFIATGDSGMGMTHGTIAGLLLTDLIVGRENPWKNLYDPGRKRVGALSEWLKENLNVAKQYGDWLTRGDVKSVEDLRPGDGAVVGFGPTKVAAFRDYSGALHQCSAVCTHLACAVSWNSTEQTFDCPCHGSRFDKFGHVIEGPAVEDLKPIQPVRKSA